MHAFSGCDTVSCFAGRGRKTVCDVRCNFDEATPIFSALATTPSLNSVDEHLPLLERFVVLIYDRTGIDTSVNEARKRLR